jgi:hypothetical protein
MPFQLVAAHELAIVVADNIEVSVAKVKVSFCDVPQNQKNVPQNGLRKNEGTQWRTSWAEDGSIMHRKATYLVCLCSPALTAMAPSLVSFYAGLTFGALWDKFGILDLLKF